MHNTGIFSPPPSFESLKRLNEHGAEFWSARDLQPILGYTQWRRFDEAIRRARTSCEQSGSDPSPLRMGHHGWGVPRGELGKSVGW